MSSLLDNHNKSTNIKENMNLDKESNNTTNLTRQSGDEETNDSNKSSSKKYVPKEIAVNVVEWPLQKHIDRGVKMPIIKLN